MNFSQSINQAKVQKSQSIKVPLRRPNICLTEAIFPTTKAVTAQKKTTLSMMKSEMKYFEASGELPPMLSKLHHDMSSIPVSSVEVERLFNAAGCFITRLRSRLNDEMIDAMCFLRSYFLCQ